MPGKPLVRDRSRCFAFCSCQTNRKVVWLSHNRELGRRGNLCQCFLNLVSALPEKVGPHLASQLRPTDHFRSDSRHDSAKETSYFMQTLCQNTTRRPRVLIADDHTIFAEALRAYLEKTCSIIGVVSDGQAMLQEAIRLRPDVVVADVSMPLLNGLDAARGIREQAPKVAFVFLTMLDDANLAAAAIELGCVAFLLKSSGGGLELLKAMEATLHSRSYLTPKLRAEDWVAAKARTRQFSKN